jgi:periplasmic protein TonB
MTQHPLVGLAAACSLSLIAHGIAYASLGLAPKPASEPPPSRVAFRVHEPEPPQLAPAKPPEPERPAPERHANAPKPKAAPPPNAPAQAPAAAPVDLRGVTLTNDTGGGAWSSAAGDGSALEGPLGPIGAKTPASKPTVTPTPASSSAPGVPVVDMADLSTRPVPPELGASLRAYYPAAARARGLGGSAAVRARIEPDGHVRRVELVSETFEGFGEACRRTLQGSSWSAPRDRDGRAVATYVRYTCRFVVGP